MILLYFLFPILWQQIIKKCNLKFFYHPISMFCFYGLVIFNYIPLPFYYFDLLPEAYDHNLRSRFQVNEICFFYIAISITIFIFGIFFY